MSTLNDLAKANPKKVTVDGESVEARSIDELKQLQNSEENDKIVAGGNQPPFGLRLAKMVPPSTG